MVTYVEGLRPVDSTSSAPKVKRKASRKDANYTKQTQQRLSPKASPVDTYARPRQDPGVGNSAFQLADALSAISPTLAKYSAQKNKDLEDEQMQKLDFYTQKFSQAKEEGAVTAAQVKEIFPELVPQVAARVAQSAGSLDAKNWAQGRVQEILENDELRLNTVARREALEKIRQEASEAVGDNEFYGGGYLSQVNKSLAEFETTWMRETAAHHEKIQEQSFADQVLETFQSGGDLEALDAEWKESSSLNNLERNSILVETVVNQAVAANDPKILNQIPNRFLNAESKANLAKAQQQIQSARYTQWVRGKEIANYQRAEQERAMKIEINRRAASGELINPAEYHNNPDVFAHAVRIAGMPMVNPTESAGTASAFRSGLLRAGTTGGFVEALGKDPSFVQDFKSDGDVTESSLRDHIVQRTDLTAEDKEALLDELPTLLGGVSLLRDPDVKADFDTYVGSAMKSLADGVYGTVLQTKGVNLQGEVQGVFYRTLERDVQAYIEDKGELPRGNQKTLLVDKAIEAAQQALERFNRMATSGPSAPQEQPQASTNPRNPSNQSTPSSDEPKEGYITLPNGKQIKKVE